LVFAKISNILLPKLYNTSISIILLLVKKFLLFLDSIDDIIIKSLFSSFFTSSNSLISLSEKILSLLLFLVVFEL
jgi:hypothetical protein